MPREVSGFFREVVQEPLKRVLGTPLLAVAYELLACDWADFDLDRPNEGGGCQAVQLTFGGGIVALEWDWREARFRDDATAFYLAINVQPRAIQSSILEPKVEGRMRVVATETVPWRNGIREVLEQVTIWGWLLESGGESPQGVSFSFPAGEFTVAIGYSPRTLTGGGVGDGDELLVLDEASWDEHLQGQAARTVLTPLCRLRDV